jgi:hypothetical protein
MTQEEFANRIGISQNYISTNEARWKGGDPASDQSVWELLIPERNPSL